MSRDLQDTDVEWSSVIAKFGTPVESSILTDEEWKQAKQQNRVVSILCTETGIHFYAQPGLLTDNVLCRVVFPLTLTIDSTIRNVTLEDINWDFSTALAHAAEATEQILEACRIGNSAALRAAISAGGDINHEDCTPDRMPPLELATLNGSCGCVEVLIHANADMSRDKGRELWRLATLHGHPDIAALLEKHGVAPVPQEALIEASHEGKFDVVANLLNGEVDIDASCCVFRPHLLEGSALTLAILARRSDVISLLMQRGADPNCRDHRGITPWIAAAASGLTDLCSELEAKGAHPELQAALVLACQIGNVPAVARLLSLGANPNENAKIGRDCLVPLEAAIVSDQFGRYDYIDVADDESAKESLRCSMVTALIEKGADCNLRSESGWPPLLHAVVRSKKAVIELLLESGANIDAVSEDGDTALLVAVEYGNLDCAKILLLRGANPNCKDADGEVPLKRMLDGWGGPSDDFAKWLIAFGANLGVTSKGGKAIRRYIKREIRRAWDDDPEVEQLKEILALLDDEYNGVFADPADTSDKCFCRASCAIDWLEDAALASRETARAVELDPGSLDRVISGLRNDRWVMRHISAFALARLGEAASPATPELIACLGDEDEDVIEAAGIALMHIGPFAVPSLSEVIRSGSAQVAQRASLIVCHIDESKMDSVVADLETRLPPDEDVLSGQQAFDVATIHGALGYIASQRDNYELAVAEFTASVRLNPNLQVGHWLELARLKAALGDESLHNAILFYIEGHEQSEGGDYGSAEEAYRRGMDAAPDFPWNYNNLAWQMATCSDRSFRNGEEAVTHATRASALTGNRYHGILDTLAAAYAEVGDYAKAAEIADRAVSVAPDYARSEYQVNRDRYRAGLPWSEYEDDPEADA